MALITCPQCGKQVSDKAKKCPHCMLDLTPHNAPQVVARKNTPPNTSPQKQKKSHNNWLVFLAGMGCMAVIVIVLWLFIFKDTIKTNKTTGTKPVVAEKNISSMSFEDLMKKDASTYLFTNDDLASLSPKELTYLRNRIYAVHGYVFKSQELNDYFSQFSWYHPDSSETADELNSTEKANAVFINSYQEENGKTYQPDSKSSK